MTAEEKHARLDELDREIDAATGWGAWMAAAIEERDELAAALQLPIRRLVGGHSLAD